MEGVITHVIKCSFFDISRGSARSHLVFGKLGGFWTGLMTAKGWCLPCCTNTNSLMNACILCSYTCVGVYCVLKESFLKSALSIQEGTKSSHYWRKRVWHSATKRPVLDVLRLVALFCLTCTSLFQCCSWFFLCAFFFLNSAVWFGLQCAAGKSQWRCRPKQPGLKWLCECSVRDSFRACGKPAHSLLTVEMREWERGRER